MTGTQHLNDGGASRELRDSLSGIATPPRPSLESISARARARQRRRTAGLATLGTGVVAAAAALTIGLTAPAGGPAPAGSPGTVRTAAFTLAHNANGTDTLTLSMRQVLNPAELQQALQRDGIPALVRTGVNCTSTPALPEPAAIGVLNIGLPNGRFLPKPAPGHTRPIPSGAVEVINPARIPAETELFFGYVRHGLEGGLINPHSYTCHGGVTMKP